MKKTIFKINGKVNETLLAEIKACVEKLDYYYYVKITKVTSNEDEVVVTWEYIYRGNTYEKFTRLKTVEEWEKFQRDLFNFLYKLAALATAISELEDAAYEVDAIID